MNVPSVPSFVPSVFPVCPNGFLAFPVFWISCHDPYKRGALVLRIFQQQGTLGTLGTGLTRHELRSAHSWNSHGTLGTERGQGGCLRKSVGEMSSKVSFPS